MDEAYRPWLWVALALHVVTAFFSHGAHQFDEHYQILEFLNYKLGGTPESSLVWEYHERMRPWFQPWLYYGVVAPLRALGLTNPFTLATILRLLSALVGWTSLVAFAHLGREWLNKVQHRRLLVVALSLAWFMPYLHARTSSENLTTSMMVFGVAWVVVFVRRTKPVTTRALGVGLVGGLLLGAAFLFRYQSGLMIAPVGLWLLFQRRWVSFLGLCFGLVAMTGVGVVVDFWGYGEWVLAPWNYLRVNILENRSADFGIQPWWYYFNKVLWETPPPWGALLVGASIYWWLEKPTHVLSLLTLPFFVTHMVIGHKELRFIFPMGPFVLAIAVLVWSQIEVTVRGFWPRSRFAHRLTKLVLIAPNTVILIVLCFMPADLGPSNYGYFFEERPTIEAPP